MDNQPPSTPADELKLRTLIKTAPDGIVIIDRLGQVQTCNPACLRLFGYGADEVIGQNVKMLMPAPYQEEHDTYLWNYHETECRRIIGIGREVHGRRKDGTVFPLELSVGEAGSDDGKVFIGIIRDITERKQQEEALLERKARLTSILETVPDAIIVIDDRGIIESFSPAAERLFGYSSDEAVGRNVSMLMPAPYRAAHDGYMDHYLTTGEKRIIGIGRVVVGQRADGTIFPMDLAVGEVNLAGRRLFTGFVRDLTEHQHAEKRLQDLQSELLHVSRFSAMGQMSSTLAHELNQPLTAITNYVKACRRMMDAAEHKPSVKVLETMDKAVAQATRAGQIIRRMRDFIEKGQTDRTAEAINKVVEEASALALVGAKQENIRVHFNLAPDAPPVWIDKIQIQQVVLNLVRNSMEALIQSPVRDLTIGTAASFDDMVEVTVHDTGPGLAPVVAANLFQPFVTTKAKGMGLGLSICRSIVDAHGGRLWATPNPDGGITFHFTVEAARPRATMSPENNGHETVFVVDDDDAVRDSLQILLESAGLTVEAFASPLEFLNSSAPDRPGCLLIDVRMPEMSGIEVQENLAAGNRQLPVIVMTGHADVPLAVRAMKAGAVDFIEKPFEDEVIIETVRRALELRPAANPEIAQRLASLTPREREVLEGLVAGRANKVIAFDLDISPRTVEIHRARVMEKMQAGSLSQLVRMALEAGILPPST